MRLAGSASRGVIVAVGLALVEAPLRLLETLGDDRLDRVGGARDERLVRPRAGSNGASTKSATSRGSPRPGARRRSAAAGSSGVAERLRDRAQPVVAREPAPSARLESAELEVDVVVDDEHARRIGALKNRAAAEIERPDSFMYVSGFRSATRRSPIRTSASRPLNFDLNDASCRRASSSTTIQPTLCRSRSCRGPDCRDPRRAGRASRPTRPDGRGARTTPRARSSRLGPLSAASASGASPSSPSASASSASAASASRARRSRAATDTVAMTVSCGSSRNVTLLDRRDVREPEDVADLQLGDVDVDVLRNVRGQRLDVELARDEREHAAGLDAAASPTSWTTTVAWIGWSSRTSRRSMCEIVPRIGSCWYSARIDGCTVCLALDDDVEDRVQARRAGHRGAELALGNDDRACVTLPVEDAGDEPLRAQAPRAARAEILALAHFELQPVSGHGGGL